MSRRVEIAGNILAEVLNYILIAALQAVLFLDVVRQWPGNVRMFFPVLVPVLFYLMRELCGSRLLFFGIHVLAPWLLAAFWGRNLPEKIIFGATAVLLSLLSVHRRLTRKERGREVVLPLAAACLFFALYLLDVYQAQGGNVEFLIFLMIGYALLYFLYLYLVHFLHYMDVNRRTTENIPVERAFASSFGLVLGFLFICAAAICLSADRRAFVWLGEIIRKGLFAALSFLASLLPKGGEAAGEIVQEAQENAGMFMMPMEQGEASPLSRILDGLFFLLSAAATAAAVAAVLFGFLRLVNAAFGSSGKKTAGREKYGGDKIERLARSERAKEQKRELLFAAKTPGQAIRRLYFVSMRRKYYRKRDEKEEKLLLGGTARECGRILFPEKGSAAYEFSRLYEKARYGQEPCSREDVRRMKRLSGELLK